MTDRDLTPATGLATDANDDLRRLKDAADFEVAEGYPDLRGWTVRTADGQTIGEVDDLIVSVGEMRVRYLDVDLDRGLRDAASGTDDDHVLIPIGTAQLDDDNDAVIVSGVSGAEVAGYPRYDRAGGITPAYEASLRGRLGGAGGAADAAAGGYDDAHFDEQRLYGKARGRGARRTAAEGEQRLTLSAEELSVGTREVQQGEVTLHKHVETERVREDVPLRREDVTVERRPLAGDAANVDIGGPSEIRVPLMAEEAVVEKRAVVKEQIVIRRQRVSAPQTVEADLRRERLEVEGDVSTTRAAGGSLADWAGSAVDDLKDRADGNAASKPGRDATDR